MAQVSADTLAHQIMEIAQSCGYLATLDPDTPRFRFFGWFRSRQFLPDIRVTNGNRSVIVVVRSQFVTIYQVFLTHQARSKKDAGAVICIPDEHFPQIRGSAKEYAEELDVRLCKLSVVGEELKDLLG